MGLIATALMLESAAAAKDVAVIKVQHRRAAELVPVIQRDPLPAQQQGADHHVHVTDGAAPVNPRFQCSGVRCRGSTATPKSDISVGLLFGPRFQGCANLSRLKTDT